MRNRLCEMFGIEVPLFAFTHCRDVVVEVSKAGGMGVLGAAAKLPEELEQDLKWIDDHIGGKPYGVDLVMPNKAEKIHPEMMKDLHKLVSEPYWAFVDKILGDSIPRLPDNDDTKGEAFERMLTPGGLAALLETAHRHPIKFLVNALGVPPKEVIDRAHVRGIKVGALTGAPKHAVAQKEAGVDVVIACGTEAGGHTGTVTSLVLWPQVVDAVAPLPVLAGGGVGRGRQFAAAMALGAQGVWCGSVWLGTRESECSREMQERFFKARSEDAVITKAISGKTTRMLRSKYTEAWVQPGAPQTLPFPLQIIVASEAQARINRARALDYMTFPVGQIVGDMRALRSSRDVVRGMLAEFADTIEKLGELIKE